MNNILYTPVLLMKAKEEVKLIHTKCANNKDLDKDNEFKRFVTLLIKTSKSRVVDIAKSYDHEFITKLSSYIHTNKSNENFFLVLYKLANDSDWKIIFSEWQNHFQNNEVKEFLANSCSKSEEFIKFKNNTIPKVDLTWLKEKNIIEYLCEKFGNVESSKLFGEILNKHAVLKDKQLYWTCLKYFLLYCNRRAYLNTKTNDILISFQGYIDNEKLIFINNFIYKLTIEDLDNQIDIYKTIKNCITIKNKLEEYLREKGTFAKYNQWLERMKLMLAFKGDRDRFDFWVKYLKGNKIIDTNYNLCIDFGNVVIIEFKIIGYAYFFYSSYFYQNIRNKLSGASERQLKDFLNRHFYENSENPKFNNIAIKRLKHSSGGRKWWSDFKYNLNSCSIYPSQ